MKAYLTGKVIPLSEVEDQVFSAGIMGDGIAIRPENDTLCAPAKGTVTMLTDTRHAIGLTLENGMEILLHVGLDTVEMNGDGFTYLADENQKVEAGTPLIRFNREKIKAAGYPREISGQAVYEDICDQIEGKENGSYVLLSKFEDDVIFEYHITIMDSEFNLGVLTMRTPEGVFEADFDK